MRWKRRRETDRRPSAKEKKMSPASSPLVPVTSRPLSLFGATEESASAVVHFCTHLTDGRRGGRTTTTTAGAKGAREKEEEKTNFFSRVSNPDLPPFLPTSSVRYASPNFRPGRAFEKRERSLTLLDPRTPLSRKRPFCARYSLRPREMIAFLLLFSVVCVQREGRKKGG